MHFDDLVKPKTGAPIATPETLTALLIREGGALMLYPDYPESFHPVFAKKKINDNQTFNTGRLYKEADRCLYSLDGGHIVGFLGLIYDQKSRSFIDESAKLWNLNLTTASHLNLYKTPEVIYLQGITLSCVTTGADGGFYHFFLEVLPKFAFCHDVINQVDHILLNGPSVEWKMKWLRHIGLDLNKIIWIDNTSHYKCKQLLFTSRLLLSQQIGTWTIKSLKELLNISLSKDSTVRQKIIWVSRKNVFERIITWEDEILQMFPDIEKIDIRSLSVADTNTLFTGTTHIIAAHGAGLCNLIMCRPGTKVLELFPDLSGYQPCYFRISALCGLHHYVAEADFNTSDGMQVCIQMLNEFL